MESRNILQAWGSPWRESCAKIITRSKARRIFTVSQQEMFCWISVLSLLWLLSNVRSLVYWRTSHHLNGKHKAQLGLQGAHVTAACISDCYIISYITAYQMNCVFMKEIIWIETCFMLWKSLGLVTNELYEDIPIWELELLSLTKALACKVPFTLDDWAIFNLFSLKPLGVFPLAASGFPKRDDLREDGWLKKKGLTGPWYGFCSFSESLCADWREFWRRGVEYFKGTCSFWTSWTDSIGCPFIGTVSLCSGSFSRSWLCNTAKLILGACIGGEMVGDGEPKGDEWILRISPNRALGIDGRGGLGETDGGKLDCRGDEFDENCSSFCCMRFVAGEDKVGGKNSEFSWSAATISVLCWFLGVQGAWSSSCCFSGLPGSFRSIGIVCWESEMLAFFSGLCTGSQAASCTWCVGCIFGLKVLIRDFVKMLQSLSTFCCEGKWGKDSSTCIHHLYQHQSNKETAQIC